MIRSARRRHRAGLVHIAGVCSLALASPLTAQIDTTGVELPYQGAWLSAGLGLGSGSNIGGAITGALSFTFEYGEHRGSVRLHGIASPSLSSSRSEVGEIGILYGRTSRTRGTISSVATGVSLGRVYNCDRVGGAECTVVGIPIVLDGMLRAGIIGLGLQAYVNLNHQAPYFGTSLLLSLGSLGPWEPAS